MRHLEGAELWLQQLVKDKTVEVCWIHGLNNPADLFTKYLNRENIIRHMNRLGFTLKDAEGNELHGKHLSRSYPESYATPQDDEWEDAFVQLLSSE